MDLSLYSSIDNRGEVECLNKKFALFKENSEKAEEKLKGDLDEAEAEILNTHEVYFFKAIQQAKCFFKEVDLSLFDIDKDIKHKEELVPKAEVEVGIEKPT